MLSIIFTNFACPSILDKIRSELFVFSREIFSSQIGDKEPCNEDTSDTTARSDDKRESLAQRKLNRLERLLQHLSCSTGQKCRNMSHGSRV